jgi:hypothetical protein
VYPCWDSGVCPAASRLCNALKVRRHPMGSGLLLAILPFVSAGSRYWKPQELTWVCWYIPVPT